MFYYTSVFVLREEEKLANRIEYWIDTKNEHLNGIWNENLELFQLLLNFAEKRKLK